MDLSFVEFSTLVEPWKALAMCTRLRSLDLEGSGINDLDDMQSMLSLLTLNLADNEVEDLDSLSVLGSCCQRLLHLDFRENPVAKEIGYRQAVGQHLPHLLEHDNQSK